MQTPDFLCRLTFVCKTGCPPVLFFAPSRKGRGKGMVGKLITTSARLDANFLYKAGAPTSKPARSLNKFRNIGDG